MPCMLVTFIFKDTFLIQSVLIRAQGTIYIKLSLAKLYNMISPLYTVSGVVFNYINIIN